MQHDHDHLLQITEILAAQLTPQPEKRPRSKALAFADSLRLAVRLPGPPAPVPLPVEGNHDPVLAEPPLPPFPILPPIPPAVSRTMRPRSFATYLADLGIHDPSMELEREMHPVRATAVISNEFIKANIPAFLAGGNATFHHHVQRSEATLARRFSPVETDGDIDIFVFEKDAERGIAIMNKADFDVEPSGAVAPSFHNMAAVNAIAAAEEAMNLPAAHLQELCTLAPIATSPPRRLFNIRSCRTATATVTYNGSKVVARFNLIGVEPTKPHPIMNMSYPYPDIVLMQVVKDFDLTHNQCGYPLKDHGNVMIGNLSLSYTPQSFNDNCRRIVGVTPMWTGGIPNLVPTVNALLTEYHAKCNGPSASHDSYPILGLKIYTLHLRILKYMRRYMPSTRKDTHLPKQHCFYTADKIELTKAQANCPHNIPLI
eukprot:scaffold245036_cov48-Prasinocladus_malaysianus.AAC.2